MSRSARVAELRKASESVDTWPDWKKGNYAKIFNSNSSVDKKLRIRKRIKDMDSCIICIRRIRGQIRKYLTNC